MDKIPTKPYEELGYESLEAFLKDSYYGSVNEDSKITMYVVEDGEWINFDESRECAKLLKEKWEQTYNKLKDEEGNN